MKTVIALLIFFFESANAIEFVSSQVAGSAGDQIITTREVRINYFVETAIFVENVNVANPKIELSQPEFQKEVTRVLIEYVVLKEADAFNAPGVPDEDVQKGVAMVLALGNKNDFQSYWMKLQVGTVELKEMIARKLRSKKFVQFKTRASVVPVTDAEALQYFQKNKSRFGGAPFSQFRDSIKQVMSQDQANQRIREWFELLQRKYRVRKVALSVKAS